MYGRSYSGVKLQRTFKTEVGVCWAMGPDARHVAESVVHGNRKQGVAKLRLQATLLCKQALASGSVHTVRELRALYDSEAAWLFIVCLTTLCQY
jgi:hypothetical protein